MLKPATQLEPLTTPSASQSKKKTDLATTFKTQATPQGDLDLSNKSNL